MAKVLTESQSYFTEVHAWFVVSRAVIVSVYMLLAIIGNGSVLCFYGKNKKLTGHSYLLALAVIDLEACMVMLPLAPLIELNMIQQSVVASFFVRLQLSVQTIGFIGILVTMALDQFIAVFWPFQHARLRRNLNRVMLVTGVIILMFLTVAAICLTLYGYNHIPFIALILILAIITLVTLLIIYPSTAYKLYRQNTSVQPQSQVQRKTQMPSEPDKGQATKPDAKKRRLHVEAMKIYTAILLQFLLVYVIGGAGVVFFDKMWMAYFSYINHIGNPVIYYCFVQKFRDGIKESAGALCRRK